MVRVTAFLTGAVTFLAAHALEVVLWRSAFAPSGDSAPWFLNAGRAVGFTAACLFLASALHTALARPPGRPGASWLSNAIAVTAGASVAMAGVLAFIGPGTIFPIVLVIGGLIAAAACSAGVWLATLVKS